jgi:hypothetical protein
MPPAKKLPRSAAMNGIHTASNPLFSSMPFATREMANRSVMTKKNRVGARLRNDDAPGLRKVQQVTPPEPGFALLGSIRFLLIRNDHFEFRPGQFGCAPPAGSTAIATLRQDRVSVERLGLRQYCHPEGEEPLSKSAVASARSGLGKHSETQLTVDANSRPPIHQRNEATGFPAVTMRDRSQTAR